LLKILRKLIIGGQLFRQKPGKLKPGVYGARASFFQKKEARKRCPFSGILPA
jgi:hypothetical protein